LRTAPYAITRVRRKSGRSRSAHRSLPTRPPPDDPVLAAHAAAIRACGRRVLADVLEVGRRLLACRNILKEDRAWYGWLDRELRLSPQTAGRFIQVHELAQGHSNLEGLDLPVSAIYLLAQPSTPSAVRDTIIARASSGEAVPLAEVRRVVGKAKETIDRAKREGLNRRPDRVAQAITLVALMSTEEKVRFFEELRARGLLEPAEAEPAEPEPEEKKPWLLH
jgi:hypothetical protein